MPGMQDGGTHGDSSSKSLKHLSWQRPTVPHQDGRCCLPAWLGSLDWGVCVSFVESFCLGSVLGQEASPQTRAPSPPGRVLLPLPASPLMLPMVQSWQDYKIRLCNSQITPPVPGHQVETLCLPSRSVLTSVQSTPHAHVSAALMYILLL